MSTLGSNGLFKSDEFFLREICLIKSNIAKQIYELKIANRKLLRIPDLLRAELQFVQQQNQIILNQIFQTRDQTELCLKQKEKQSVTKQEWQNEEKGSQSQSQSQSPRRLPLSSSTPLTPASLSLAVSSPPYQFRVQAPNQHPHQNFASSRSSSGSSPLQLERTTTSSVFSSECFPRISAILSNQSHSSHLNSSPAVPHSSAISFPSSSILIQEIRSYSNLIIPCLRLEIVARQKENAEAMKEIEYWNEEAAKCDQEMYDHKFSCQMKEEERNCVRKLSRTKLAKVDAAVVELNELENKILDMEWKLKQNRAVGRGKRKDKPKIELYVQAKVERVNRD